MMEKCYNKTQSKALKDGNLKGLLITTNCKELAMTTANNTRNIERGQSSEHLIYGVGRNSRRNHKSRMGNKKTKAYAAWHCALQRCYDPKFHERSPTYIGCSVDKRWHDFQDFADWFYGHEYGDLGYALDKDLLLPDNKIYSPETCCLVPTEINNLLLDNQKARGELPQGVDFHKKRGLYRVKISISGKSKTLGFFNCPNEAHQVYKEAKERHVKNTALSWADRIEHDVFVALINWTLDS